MESAPTVDQVCEVIKTLHYDPVSSNKESASIWLQNFQLSVFSWTLCDQILRSDHGLEYVYFSAQTLCSKVRHNFTELPSSSYASLRDSFIDHMLRLSESKSNVVMNQLYLGFTSLVLQMPPNDNLISDIITLSKHNSIVGVSLLRSLPEELDSRLKLGETRRSALQKSFQNNIAVVFQYLNECMHSCKSAELSIKILKCVTSWLSFPSDFFLNFSDCLFFKYSFQILANVQSQMELYLAACGCVSAAVRLCRRKSKFTALCDSLFRSIFALVDAYNISVTSDINYVSEELCDLFCAIAEIKAQTFHNAANDSSLFLAIDTIINCMKNKDVEIIKLTLGFWSILTDQLTAAPNADINTRFRPYIENFLIIIINVCTMDSDTRGVLSTNSDVFELRESLSALVVKSLEICGSVDDFLASVLQNVQPSILCDSTNWIKAEVFLFMFSAVLSSIYSTRNPKILNDIVESVLNMSASVHVAVRHTALCLMPVLAECVLCRQPLRLESALKFICLSFSTRDLHREAAAAFRSVCVKCTPHLAQQLSVLVDFVVTLDNDKLDSSSRNDLLESVLTVLNQASNVNKVHLFEKMSQPTLLSLLNSSEKIRASTEQADNQSVPSLFLVRIDTLSVLFKFCNCAVSNTDTHPCLSTFTQAWPIMSFAMVRFSSNNVLMEKCVRCVRYALRALHVHALSFLQSLVKCVADIYSQQQHSCFLYLASILLDEFSACEEHTGTLMSLTEFLISASLRDLTPHNLASHSDTLDDLFRLCRRCMLRMPDRMLGSEGLAAVISLAIAAIPVDHRDVNVSVFSFFCTTLDVCDTGSSRHPASSQQLHTSVSRVLDAHGYSLISSLLRALVTSSYSLDLVHDSYLTIEKMFAIDRQTTLSWFQQFLTEFREKETSYATTLTEDNALKFYNMLLSSQSEDYVFDALRYFADLFS